MTTFKDAVTICLTQKYINFEGRAARSEYWFFVLFSVIVYVVACVIDGMLGMMAFYPLSLLAFLIPSLAVGVRRLHDIDKSGWWLLIGFIPLLGLIGLIYFYVQPGTDGENRFGENPL